MTCPKCSSWRVRAVRAPSSPVIRRRRFHISRTLLEEAQPSTELSTASRNSNPGISRLHILKSKTKRISSPNDRIRPAIHGTDISTHLGTRYARPVIGGMEWQTSSYHYNKQTSRTFPVLSQTTDKLLEAYAVLRRMPLDNSGQPIPTSRVELAKRRKSAEKMYISSSSVKDYGNKVVVNAYVYDGIEAVANERAEQLAKMKAKAKARAQRMAGKVSAGGRPRPGGQGGQRFGGQRFGAGRPGPPRGPANGPQRGPSQGPARGTARGPARGPLRGLPRATPRATQGAAPKSAPRTEPRATTARN